MKKTIKKKSHNDFVKVSNFLYEIGTLRKITRSHRQVILEDDISDSIASHSYRVTMIGFFLAKLEKANIEKVIQMCLFHDTPETRSGDHNWIHKRYVKVYEDEIIKEQAQSLPWTEEMLELQNEYNTRVSLEAHIAKDADLLDQVLLLKEYAHKGNKEAQLWLVDKEDGKRLYTKSAKKLVKAIVNQEPNDWWKNLWTNVNR